MCVVLNQTKNGVPAACWRSMKSSPCSSTSSSIVSMRFFVSGPVSSIRCLPTRPQRGWSVESSSSVAQRVQHAARPEPVPEVREVLGWRVVR